MNPRNKLLAPVVALSIVAATAGSALAENGNDETSDQADVEMMMAARITLAGAIQAAEAAQSGKALSASFEANNRQPAYEVEVATSGGKTEAVLIDAQTGQVLKKLTDNEQGEDGEGGESGQNGESEKDESD